MHRYVVLCIASLGLAPLLSCSAAPDTPMADQPGKDATTQALAAQISVEATRSDPANRAALLPDTAPPNGQTLGQLAAQQARQQAFGGCARQISYALRWSLRLPAHLPLYPRSRVDEAAGVNTPACRLRAVTMTSAASVQDIRAFYLHSARRAGYATSTDVDEGQSLISGTRRDGAAFFIVLTPVQSGGTSIDLVVNNGV